MRYLIWLLIALAGALLLACVFIRLNDILAILGRNRKQSTTSIKFEKRKNLSEKDQERSRNYRKLFRDFFSSISGSLSSKPKSRNAESPETKSEASGRPPTSLMNNSAGSSSLDNIMLHGGTKSFGLGKALVIYPKHIIEAKRLKASKAVVRRAQL